MSTTPKMDPPRTIWMRFTSNDGSAHVSEHVVWNKDLFLSRKADDAAAERARPDAGKGLAKAEQITEEQYKAER